MSFRQNLARAAVERVLQRARELATITGVVLVILLVIDRRAGLAWVAVGLTAAATLGIHWLRWRAQSWFTPKATDAYGHAQFVREREAAERAGLSSGTESNHG
jgi:hypothetical protein